MPLWLKEFIVAYWGLVASQGGIMSRRFILAAVSAGVLGMTGVSAVAQNPQAGPGGGIHPFIGIEGGFGQSNSNFGVSPPFTVNGGGFVGGINGGLLIEIPGTIFSAGPRLGYLGGSMSGTTSNPSASPGNSYKAETRGIMTAEFETQLLSAVFHAFRTSFLVDPNLSSGVGWTLALSLGFANVKTAVTGTGVVGNVSDSKNQVGFTAAIRAGMPISNSLALEAGFRYANVGRGDFNLPGTVRIDRDIFIGTVGVKWLFNTQATR